MTRPEHQGIDPPPRRTAKGPYALVAFDPDVVYWHLSIFDTDACETHFLLYDPASVAQEDRHQTNVLDDAFTGYMEGEIWHALVNGKALPDRDIPLEGEFALPPDDGIRVAKIAKSLAYC
jgi:hypothetical protein